MIRDLPDLLASRAMLSGGMVALEETATGATLTYAELDRRASRAAAMLAGRGVKAGDRVAILCRNRAAFFELLFGCARIGAVLVPLNWRMPALELDSLVAHAEPALLCHGAECRALVDELVARPETLDLDHDYERLLAAAPPVEARATWPAGDTWYLLYTSGTTGRPKGVIYTYAMALANFINVGSATGLGAADRVAAFLPLFHTAGINLYALPALFAGGRVLVMAGFEAGALLRLIEERRIDLLFGVPTIFHDLIEHPGFASAPLGQVRHWGCGGAALPDRLAERYREAGIRLCSGMGMTETGPMALLMSPEDAWDRIGSVGRPQLLCSARIVDEAGRDLPDGAVGELLFAGPAVTPGYWRDEEATRAAFTADSWLRSGDLARRDADGLYWVSGRRKEMFVSGGENVYPAEVEKVLACHPAVMDAAVLAVPDTRWGETGEAYVQLAPGTGALPPEDLRAFCRARLAPYKVPKSFRFVEDFPRTSAGKIQKHLLA
ncbi:AMP-binding protein [Sphingosinicella sp. YJ22]|uniref:class I adenylate-forming enzyme family protein n=1 Tax=Sphingosinicella sp. YJ22 TaxID=1104780 RepID=UPI00140E7D19|nr:AMP-binding protein [Sphingosinicella sp. YJ22]